jgi:hypothetical protein
VKQNKKHFYYKNQSKPLACRIEIHEFSRAKNTGVWYFHVETSMASLPPYSVPRRYTEFVELHDKIKRVVSHEEKIPPLPMKEYNIFIVFYWRRNIVS